MEVKTEPAGRLYDIFLEARKKPQNDSARKVWAEIFGIPKEDTGTILKMLADLIQLTNETKEKIARFEDIDTELYLRPFAKIEQILSQINLDGTWQHWKNQIDEPMIYGLQFCSDKLARSTNYTAINQKSINALKESLTELSDQVQESDIDGKLKELLVRNLERLRQALISYKIRGIEGIEQEIELNVGFMVLNKEKIIKDASTTKRNGLWKSYIVFIEGINKTLATAKSVKELGGKELMKLIGLDNG